LVGLQKEKPVDKIMHVLDKELKEMEEEELDRHRLILHQICSNIMEEVMDLTNNENEVSVIMNRTSSNGSAPKNNNKA
jgi:hypothetical protein